VHAEVEASLARGGSTRGGAFWVYVPDSMRQPWWWQESEPFAVHGSDALFGELQRFAGAAARGPLGAQCGR